MDEIEYKLSDDYKVTESFTLWSLLEIQMF